MLDPERLREFIAQYDQMAQYDQSSLPKPWYDNETGLYMKFETKSNWYVIQEVMPQLNQLAELGHAPTIQTVKDLGINLMLIGMEFVDGLTLPTLPADMEEKYTIEFAQKVAQLFLVMKRLDLYQTDPNPLNYIYDKEHDKIVAVDLHSIRNGGGKLSWEDYVSRYCYTMASVYLGDSAFNYVFSNSALVPSLAEEFKRRNLAEKVDPWLVDFVIKGNKPDTVPDSLDPILNRA